MYGGVRRVPKNSMTGGRDTSISVRLITRAVPYSSDQSRITQFTIPNFWEMVIARPTNLLLRKQAMVVRRLQNWSVLAMFKGVLAAPLLSEKEVGKKPLSRWQANWWNWKANK